MLNPLYRQRRNFRTVEVSIGSKSVLADVFSTRRHYPREQTLRWHSSWSQEGQLRALCALRQRLHIAQDFATFAEQYDGDS
jgi:hypothetical protein